MTTAHRAITGVDLHVPGYKQGADPGAVGAGMVWHDTDDDKVYVRNAADSGWVELTGGAAIDYAEDGDISTQAFGDSPAAGASTTEVAGANHKHGMPANPLVGSVATINFVIDGGGAVIATGIKGDLVIDFACTILGWTLLGDQSGSIVVDIWKDTYANFPPVVGDSITASAKPTISAATKGQSSTLTGWTTSIAAGDVLRFNVDSITTCQRVTLALKVERT